jgi:1-acyl-sn-glycerol-3-phosphate acyltransferase
VAGRLELQVEGREHFPAQGPVLVAARHYHHLYDGCVLLAAAPRALRLVVALDWVSGPWGRRGMEALCGLAEWPVLLRTEMLHHYAGAFRPKDGQRYVRRGIRQAVRLLAEGQAVAIFPEAYPAVDPRPGPRGGAEFLPFRSGFAVLAALASRRLQTPVPVLPAGLAYEGRRVRLAFGPPVLAATSGAESELVRRTECEVRCLSGGPSKSALSGGW